MILNRRGVELYVLGITTDPEIAPTDWEASFDQGTTFHDCTTDPSVPERSRWLLAGPDAVGASGAAVEVVDTCEPLLRHIGDPEHIYRRGPEVTIVD